MRPIVTQHNVTALMQRSKKEKNEGKQDSHQN
jgi:hypothetical protein